MDNIRRGPVACIDRRNGIGRSGRSRKCVIRTAEATTGSYRDHGGVIKQSGKRVEESVIKTAVITVSDSRTEHDDVSGDRLVELLTDLGAEIVERASVSDDRECIEQTIFELTERSDINLILTTGGTGFAPRD